MIDLHMHSKYSEDGEFTPEELAELCQKAGVSVMSVTDHNCAKANKEAKEAAERRGIRCIPGIEIDCTYQGRGFHVLGYGIALNSGDFDRIEQHVAKQALTASMERLEKTRRLGFHVTDQEL